MAMTMYIDPKVTHRLILVIHLLFQLAHKLANTTMSQ